MIEETDLLSATRYFSDPLHDALLKRDERFRSLTTKAELSDLVFLDPDKGLQVKSISYGAANSSQYLFLHEAQKLWELGKSLLIYQHFPREKRAGYIRKRVKELQCRITNSHVSAFLTAHVVFLMVLQPKHKSYYKSIVEKIEERWNGQIDHRSPILPRFCRHVRDLVSAARRIIARFSRLVSALISASRR